MANLAPARPGSQEAVALWLLDLGITAAEARRWATTDPEHPAASCLELIDLMESLVGAP
jgi:hypothetical protein